MTDPLIAPELLDLQPTCLERIHYPVFDPHNPQHNPTAVSTGQQSPLGHRQYFQASSSESNRQSSWLEDFPRRSIHKARSGLLAIRASIFRLSSRENSDLSDSVIEKLSRENASPERNGAREAGLSSATEEDLSFGIRLYRTSTSPWGPDLAETEEISMPRVESPLSIVNFMPTAVETENYHHHARHETEPSNDQYVSMTSEEPPPYRSIEEIVRCHRLSKDSNARENANEELGAESASETYGCLTRSSPSADWDELGSPASSFRYEDMVPHRNIPRTPIISPVGSIISSEHGPVTAQSDEFVSHEGFTSHHRSATVDIDEHEHSKVASNSSSEVVTIAFPGIYQALLEQWTSDLRKNVKNIPFVPKNPGYSSFMVAQALQDMDGEDSGRESSRERHSFGLHMALRAVSHLFGSLPCIKRLLFFGPEEWPI